MDSQGVSLHFGGMHKINISIMDILYKSGESPLTFAAFALRASGSGGSPLTFAAFCTWCKRKRKPPPKGPSAPKATPKAETMHEKNKAVSGKG